MVDYGTHGLEHQGHAPGGGKIVFYEQDAHDALLTIMIRLIPP
jgi:hypothetical protein